MKAPSAAEKTALLNLVTILESPTFWCAAALALALTVPLALFHVSSQSKAKYGACANSHFFAYMVLLAFGNIMTTAVALTYVQLEPTSREIAFTYAILGAVIGITGFESLIKHTNITIWGKSVLTIAKWIQTAKDTAVTATTKKDINVKQAHTARLVAAFAAMPVAELNAMIEAQIGAGEVAKMNAKAGKSESDPQFYKATRFVEADPDRAQAILDARRNRP